MNTRNRTRWGALVLGLATVLTACEPGSFIDDFGTPVAWIDDEPVMIEDVRAEGPAEAVEKRRERLDRAVDDFIAAREARRRGLGYTEQAVRKIAAIRRAAEVRERRVLRQTLFEVVSSEIAISESETRAEFERTKGTNRHRTLTLRTQTFPSRADAARASGALGDSGWLDPQMAVDIGPRMARELPRALRKVAKRLQEPGSSAVEQIDGRWQVIQLLTREFGDPPTFENAREAIERNLREQRAEELFRAELDRLRSESTIRIEPGAIENDALWLPPA